MASSSSAADGTTTPGQAKPQARKLRLFYFDFGTCRTIYMTYNNINSPLPLIPLLMYHGDCSTLLLRLGILPSRLCAGGRAEAIRLALHVGGVEFEDVRITEEDFRRTKAGVCDPVSYTHLRAHET